MWTSTDPNHQFWNPYAYVGNGYNPVAATDPDGRDVHALFWSSGKGPYGHAAIAYDAYRNGKPTGWVVVTDLYLGEHPPMSAVGDASYKLWVVRKENLDSFISRRGKEVSQVFTYKGGEAESEAVRTALLKARTEQKMYDPDTWECVDYQNAGLDAISQGVDLSSTKTQKLDYNYSDPNKAAALHEERLSD